MQNLNEIIPGIFIGNEKSATSPQILQKNNITAVVNCTPDVPNQLSGPTSSVEYMRLTLDDSGENRDIEKMYHYLPSAILFIRKNHFLEGKNVLVHCHAGIQRSATVVCAYLTAFYTKNLKESKRHILQKRPICFFGGINFRPALEKFFNQTIV